MKIKIGNYIYRRNARKYHDNWLFWRYGEKSYTMEDKDYDFLDRSLDKMFDRLQTVLNATVNKKKDKQERQIKIQIDDYDVWNADHTLALIILPMLKKIKTDKQGSPFVDDSDVPEHIRSCYATIVEKYETDEFFHDRWNWVMDELIWTFEKLVDDSWEQEFYSGEVEANTFKVDEEGMKKVQDRINNGLRLFGKYYQSLWT